MPLSHTSEAQHSRQWWAQGDTPARTDSRIAYLIDGRTAFLVMSRHFLKAHSYIYLANWGLTPEMELVRGSDRRAGPDGSPAQEAVVAQLRREGLQEADIAFWLTHDLSLQAVLGYAVSKGVEVKVLLWHCSALFSHYDPRQAYDQLTAVGVSCILDESARGLLHHPVESLHQKIAIVDGTSAFVGGVDPLIEKAGEFDRWDTPAHVLATPLRQTSQGTNPHPWHDAHALLEGPAAGDVEFNFQQRWNDVVTRHHWDENLLVPKRPLPPGRESKSVVQVVRTIPEHTYRFSPPIIRGIAQLYANALKNVERFMYLENQYFWLRTYSGLDDAFLGSDSAEMEQNIRLLGEALQRGAWLSIILPDHPNVGRAFSDSALKRLQTQAREAAQEGRLQAFCLATSTTVEGREHYLPIYVHAKVALVDDIWATVGSANLNNRGMRDDTEMNVATLDADIVRNLRFMLQAEHLGLLQEEDLFTLSRWLGNEQQTEAGQERTLGILHTLQEQIGDPLIALRLMQERAWENLRLYKANKPLVGHLLPYLTADEARQHEVNFHEDHGWLEAPE